MVLFFFDELTVANVWGNLIAIFSGISFAWMTLFLRKQKSGSAMESVFLGNCLAALICLPFMFQDLPSARGWILLVLLGVVQLALPYFFYAKAIKYVTAIEAITIPLIEPILNPIWVFLAIGERPGPMAVADMDIENIRCFVIGMGIILKGLSGLNNRRVRGFQFIRDHENGLNGLEFLC